METSELGLRLLISETDVVPVELVARTCSDLPLKSACQAADFGDVRQFERVLRPSPKQSDRGLDE